MAIREVLYPGPCITVGSLLAEGMVRLLPMYPALQGGQEVSKEEKECALENFKEDSRRLQERLETYYDNGEPKEVILEKALQDVLKGRNSPQAPIT